MENKIISKENVKDILNSYPLCDLFILRKKLPGIKNKYNTFPCFCGKYKTSKDKYSIYWIHSSEMKQQDYEQREERINSGTSS